VEEESSSGDWITLMELLFSTSNHIIHITEFERFVLPIGTLTWSGRPKSRKKEENDLDPHLFQKFKS
jgi:hypothetical protein